MGIKGRENSILNMLMYGRGRLVDFQAEEMLTESHTDGWEKRTYTGHVAERTYDGKAEDWGVEMEGKERDISEPNISYQLRPSKKMKMIFQSVLVVSLTIYMWASSCGMKIPLWDGDEIFERRIVGIAEQKNTSVPVDEVIQVSYPHVPSNPDAVLVSSQSFLNHVFGNSWNTPFVVDYTPPENVTYDSVVLTLNTSVNSTQYDRLAHLFLNDVSIWRTSTIEPHGASVSTESSFKKDLTRYLKLFQQKGQVKLLLNNVVTDSLKGEFDITIQVDYYKTPLNSSTATEKQEDTGKGVSHGDLFKPKRSADRIYPLVTVDGNKAPLVSLPSGNLNVTLPQLNKNVTHLTLSVFTSGNGAEEFWYSNVLDNIADSFKGAYGGHGPLRFLNIYFNGKKVFCFAPTPVIFTGGLSPSLWSSVVSYGTFDLPTIDIDLTPLLPYLWTDSASSERALQIEVGNGLDEIFSLKSGIGQDWITTANLLAYENDRVRNASGNVLDVSSSKRGVSLWFDEGDQSALSQIVNAGFETQLTSELSFDLVDGSSLNTKYVTSSQIDASNVQQLTKNGSMQEVVYSPSSHYSVSIEDKLSSKKIAEYEVKEAHPLVLDSTSKDVDNDTDLDIDIVFAHKVETSEIGFSKLVSSVQNGSSNFVISDKGNHGSAITDTKYKYKVEDSSPSTCYKRHVKSKNGNRIEDDIEDTFPGQEKGDACSNEGDYYISLSSISVNEPGWDQRFESLSQVIDNAGIAESLKTVLEKFANRVNDSDTYDQATSKRPVPTFNVTSNAALKKYTF